MPQAPQHNVIITLAEVRRWRAAQDIPRARMAIYFGIGTVLWFVDGLEPDLFDFFPTASIRPGMVMFDRTSSARRDYPTLLPEVAEIIFG